MCPARWAVQWLQAGRASRHERLERSLVGSEVALKSDAEIGRFGVLTCRERESRRAYCTEYRSIPSVKYTAP